MTKSDFVALDDLEAYELMPNSPDPLRYTVLGARDFVLGRVRRLIASVAREEVVYLVVSTAISNFREGKGEERLVPVSWAELVSHRRQVKLPQLSSLAFRRLPLYHPGGTLPEAIDFPQPAPDEIEFWDIA